MTYCPRCRKLVNVSIQTSKVAMRVLETFYCGECGMTINSVLRDDIMEKINKRRKNHGKEQEE